MRDPGVRIELTGRLADTAIEANRADDPAVAAAVRELQLAYPDDAGAQAYAAAVSGQIALASGDGAGARERIERAIFFESQRARPIRLADWYLLMARAAPERRAIYALDAYRALESVRAFLPPRDPLTGVNRDLPASHAKGVRDRRRRCSFSPKAGGGAIDIAGAQSIVEDARDAGR